MQFSYIALSPEYQRLTGVINAENEEEARKKLHAMGLSVISITKEEANQQAEQQLPKPTQAGTRNFYFKVVNSKGQNLDGTIESTDRKTAFRRLVGEYNFKVLLLADANLSPEEREKQGTEGLQQIAKEVEGEFAAVEDDKNKKTKSEQAANEDAYTESEQKKRLLEEVDEVSKMAEQILEKYNKQLSGEEVHEIKQKHDELMRMRLSNNLKYIQNLTEDLFLTIEQTLRSHANDNNTVKEMHAIKKQYKQKSETTAEDDSKYKSAIAFKGAMDDIRRVANLMANILNKEQEKKEKEVVLGGETQSVKVFQFLKILIHSLQGYLFSKSVMRKQAYIQSISEAWQSLKLQWQERSEQKELEEVSEKDQELIRIAEGKDITLYDELYLFIGWLLAFYITYFFFAFYVKFKWNIAGLIFDFVSQSVQVPFLIILTGILFIVFLGLSLKVHFAKRDILKSSLIFVCTLLLITVFVFNF